MANSLTTFIGKAKARAERNTRLSGRLDFAMDATGSREDTWAATTPLVQSMFDKVDELGGGDLRISLGHFGGMGWRWEDEATSADILKSQMGEVRCIMGMTKMVPLFTARLPRLNEPHLKPAATIYIGDAFEENKEDMLRIARQYGDAKSPIFIFLARTLSSYASVIETFKEIARLSGGAYAELDESAAAAVEDMLGAVAAYAGGGIRALLRASASGSEAATLLLTQMKKD